MIGKKRSLDTFPKNSQHWSWDDIGWQTIAEVTSIRWKRTVTNSGQPCMSDHQLWGWRQPETVAVGIGDALDVVGKILWHQSMQASVNEHSQLEIYALHRPQPLKVSQHVLHVCVLCVLHVCVLCVGGILSDQAAAGYNGRQHSGTLDRSPLWHSPSAWPTHSLQVEQRSNWQHFSVFWVKTLARLQHCWHCCIFLIVGYLCSILIIFVCNNNNNYYYYSYI